MALLGRGSAYTLALLLVSFFCLDRAHAVVHTVGGAKGWDLSVDYAGWAKGETFKVGDVLFFPYDPVAHDVVVVDKAGYDTCSATNAIATYNKGNESLTLSSAGSHYYLCSLPGHCPFGMKLAVTVGAAATPPTATTPAPTKAAPAPPKAAPAPPKTAPSPTPSATKKAPSPAPASAPAPASPPTPVPSPASAPAPAVPSPAPGVSTPPSSPAPASTPSATTSSPPAPPNAAPSSLASANGLALLVLMASLLAL